MNSFFLLVVDGLYDCLCGLISFLYLNELFNVKKKLFFLAKLIVKNVSDSELCTIEIKNHTQGTHIVDEYLFF